MRTIIGPEIVLVVSNGVDLRVQVAGVATHLPARQLTSREVEDRVAAESGFALRPGIIERMTGIQRRYVLPDDWQASDLAVAATEKLLADAGHTADEVDLLIFASASQDMVEPATAHMVAAKLGARCPVFDVKNACNSILNGMQVAEALILAGQHRRVVVCTGESPSRAIRWMVRDSTQFVESFAGYTLSDSGAALLLEPATDGRGIFLRSFAADSVAWDAGTLPAGGSAYPRDPDATYFRIDGPRLKDAFERLGAEHYTAPLAAAGLSWTDFAVVCVHQVALSYLDRFATGTGIPLDRLVVTLPDHGNLASATLARQLELAIATGRCGPGDRAALVGLAGGVSLGLLAMRL